MTVPETAHAPDTFSSPTVTLLGFSFRKEAVRAVLTAYLVTRAMALFITFISSIVIPMESGPFSYADPNNIVLDGLIRFDSWWYTNIVEHGYNLGNIETQQQGNVAFFPLYPLLVRMIAGLTGNVFVAGVLVSHVALLVALGFLYALTQLEFDDQTAGRAVFYLASAPTSIFFSAMYTESLFVALVTATFFYARTAQWHRAALTGALAAATRNTGVLLAAVIALEGMHQQGFRIVPSSWRPAGLVHHVRTQLTTVVRSWRSLLAAAFVPVGLIAFMAYLSNTFGDPLAFIHVQATFGRDVSTSGAANLLSTTITRLNFGPGFFAGQTNPRTVVDTLATLGFGFLVVALPFKLRPAHVIFTALTLLVPLASGTVSSMTRYVLMLVPCFMLLAYWGRREWVDRLVMGIFLPLMAYFTVLFSHWYFAG